MPEAPIIESIELRKSYGAAEVLRGLTFEVPRGSVFGLLGRNGAGKTTTMKVLLGMTRPTSGSMRAFGLSTAEPAGSLAIRRRSAFVSEGKDLYEYMTVAELTKFAAAMYPSWQVELERKYFTNFEIRRDSRVKALSQGARTKLTLLLALASGAELLVLDEPTAGLDPAAAEEVLQALISYVSQQGVTVFFSSHHIVEIEQIADHVAILNRGEVVVSGALDEVRERFQRLRLVFERDVPRHAIRAYGMDRVRCDGRVMTVMVCGDLERALLEAGTLRPISVDVVPVTLKEIFLESVASER